MKKEAVIACVICTLAFAAAGLAQPPREAPLPPEALAAILGQSPSCPTPQSEAVLAAAKPGRPGFGPLKSCNATATCESGSVSCSVPGAGGTCTFANRNCDIDEPGHVTCNGVTTWCPTDCPCDDRPVCCTCFATGDCFACCRCDGGSIGSCLSQCGGF